MSEIIDRVAKAIEEVVGEYWCDYEEAAKAAIKAMREPTDEMLCDDDFDYLEAKVVWQGMIDEALKE